LRTGEGNHQRRAAFVIVGGAASPRPATSPQSPPGEPLSEGSLVLRLNVRFSIAALVKQVGHMICAP
jgi:hypothetical protein